MARLYTRTGDEGETLCFALGRRVKKYHPLIEFMGAIDEANSALGLARAACREGSAKKLGIDGLLVYAQKLLFHVGFSVSGSGKLSKEDLDRLEKEVDKLMEGVELKGFILPSGGECASRIHLARSIVRRAERRMFEIIDKGLIENIDRARLAAKILNRLSDALFAAAFRVAHEEGTLEFL